jgi:hypothetical protein
MPKATDSIEPFAGVRWDAIEAQLKFVLLFMIAPQTATPTPPSKSQASQASITSGRIYFLCEIRRRPDRSVQRLTR